MIVFLISDLKATPATARPLDRSSDSAPAWRTNQPPDLHSRLALRGTKCVRRAFYWAGGYTEHDMRDDSLLKLALGSGLAAASAAVLLVATPASIPLFLVSAGALAVSVAELVRHS